MKTCIVFLGHRQTCSIVEDEILILHNPIDMNALPNFLYQQSFDSLIFLCEGTPIPHQVDDSYTISKINQNNSEFPVVLKDTDMRFFTDLATILHINDVKVVSYMDYIADKFKSSEGAIVVSPYLNRYAVFAVQGGEIIDCALALEGSLEQKISSFMDKYKFPVYNAEQPNDKLLKMFFKNYMQIPTDQLFSLDFIPFCISDVGISLLDNLYTESFNDESTNLQEESEGEQRADPNIVNLVSSDIAKDKATMSSDFMDRSEFDQPRRHTKYKKHNLNFNTGDKEAASVFVDIGIKVAIFLVAALIIFSILFVVLFKQKAVTTSVQVKVLQEQAEVVDSMQSYCSGDMTYSPAYLLSEIYKSVNVNSVLNCSYNTGNLYITVISCSQSEKDKNEEMIKSSFDIKEEALMGKYKKDDIVYDKVKYLITPRSS